MPPRLAREFEIELLQKKVDTLTQQRQDDQAAVAGERMRSAALEKDIDTLRQQMSDQSQQLSTATGVPAFRSGMTADATVGEVNELKHKLAEAQQALITARSEQGSLV